MPTFVGIDLAWGMRGRTGLAAVDDSGALVSAVSVRTDDEIAAFVDEFSPTVIGVDAPLVVPNESGMRLGEREISRAFGRFGIGAHASHRGMAYMNPPRAEVLAARFGWAVDPDSPDRPLALEVYPHPAIVSLFALPYRLAYKKPGGYADYLRLLDLMESIPELRLGGSAAWARLHAMVVDPTPGSRKRAEDEIDAIVCAHLAWLWHARPGSLRVYGNVTEGYVVAPAPKR